MSIYQERARFGEGWICTVKLVTGLQRALHELTTAGWLYPPVWEERRRQRKPAGVCQGEKLLPRELSASQDYHHSLKSLLPFCQFPFFFFFKWNPKRAVQIHKSQLQHPGTWHAFCQQCCLFRARATLCATQGDISVPSLPVSPSTSVSICQQSDTFSSLSLSKAPAQIPLWWTIKLSFHSSHVLSAARWSCMPTSALTATHLLISMWFIIYFHVADSLLFKVLFRSWCSACIWLNTAWLLSVGFIRGRYPYAQE